MTPVIMEQILDVNLLVSESRMDSSCMPLLTYQEWVNLGLGAYHVVRLGLKVLNSFSSPEWRNIGLSETFILNSGLDIMDGAIAMGYSDLELFKCSISAAGNYILEGDHTHQLVVDNEGKGSSTYFVDKEGNAHSHIMSNGILHGDHDHSIIRQRMN